MKAFVAGSCVVHVHALQLLILAGVSNWWAGREIWSAGEGTANVLVQLAFGLAVLALFVATPVVFGICFLQMCRVRRAIGKSTDLMPREWNSELWSPMSDVEKSWVQVYAGSIFLLTIVPPGCFAFFPAWVFAGFTGYSYVFACYSARNGIPSKRARLQPSSVKDKLDGAPATPAANVPSTPI